MVPKFRGWHKELEQMIYGKEVCGHIEYTTNLIDALNTMLNEDDYDIEVMQSTGLKDRKGVEIFEGDVVSLTEGECSYSGIVVRDYYEFYIKGIGPRDCFDFQDVSNTFDGTTSLEVTTNIYKNPELLKQANES